MPSTNHQGSHGTKSQLSSFQTSLQNTKFCDSIRYQMKMFAFVQLFLGRTSLTSMPARFFDAYGSELVLMHSGFQLLLCWWETVRSPYYPPQQPHLSPFQMHFYCSCGSLMQQISRDRWSVSIESPVCNPARWKGRESLGSKHSWCQSRNPSYLGGGRQRKAGCAKPWLHREFKDDLGKLN